jgi:hypothetical protein
MTKISTRDQQSLLRGDSGPSLKSGGPLGGKGRVGWGALTGARSEAPR